MRQIIDSEIVFGGRKHRKDGKTEMKEQNRIKIRFEFVGSARQGNERADRSDGKQGKTSRL